jgi:hypothetical protein
MNTIFDHDLAIAIQKKFIISFSWDLPAMPF